MLNLFKSQETIIQEIHDSFDSAQDRLLAESKEIIEKEANLPTEDKGLRLKKIGFANTPDALDYQKKLEEYNLQQQEKEQHLRFAKTVEMYKFQYPFLKFLTEGELDRICQKYGLVYAPVGRYKKVVPEKNLREIETAQPIKSEHSVSKRKLIHLSAVNQFLSGNRAVYDQARKYGIEVCRLWRNKLSHLEYDLSLPFKVTMPHQFKVEEQDLSGLFIAAPPSHFDLKGLKKNKLGFFQAKIFEVKDPIVFRYCKGGIQVITKWGLEANDPALVNEKMN